MKTNRPPRTDIPGPRKGLYYFGMGLTAVGMVLFLSVLVRGCSHFGDFSNFDADARISMGSAIGAVVLIGVGRMLADLGRRGLAGSGVVIDPGRARADLEPWSRMAGGMVKDALEEADVRPSAGPPGEVVKVRCPACKALNDEHDKFCGQCGGKLA